MTIATAAAHHRQPVSLTFPNLPDFFQTIVKFRNFSRFSGWVFSQWNELGQAWDCSRQMAWTKNQPRSCTRLGLEIRLLRLGSSVNDQGQTIQVCVQVCSKLRSQSKFCYKPRWCRRRPSNHNNIFHFTSQAFSVAFRRLTAFFSALWQISKLQSKLVLCE